ncbi:MAG: hypothetical protein F9K19_09960 [Rhizobiaceae bacterium]|nr:MAG: hypothetical protein F9K19_09960 [Rhizobiaceae bacterium]CAG0962786.1 hypothetical protein RHIZO_00795 [Rhizobiaceae bacterium]
MHKVLILAALSAAVAMPAFAGAQYDRKLEQAAIEIVAAKMGALRGGFSFDARLAFVTADPEHQRDQTVTGSIGPTAVAVGDKEWERDLAPAVERRISRIILF